MLLFVPEEVPTQAPTHEHAEVDRPKVLAGTVGHLCDDDSLVGTAFGKISRITLLRALCSFSPVTPAPATEILGVAVPEGDEFGLLFLDVTNNALPAAGAPIVSADLGVELASDTGRTLTFFTRGVGHFVEISVDAGLPSELADHVRRHCLAPLA